MDRRILAISVVFFLLAVGVVVFRDALPFKITAKDAPDEKTPAVPQGFVSAEPNEKGSGDTEDPTQAADVETPTPPEDQTADAETGQPDPDPAEKPWPREAQIKVVWFSGAGKTAKGGTTTLLLRISKNDTGRPSVGSLDHFPGSSGRMWTTSLWMSAFVACEHLGVDISDYEFVIKTLDSESGIDGPSAGMVMTAALSALLKGEDILDNVAMTGTINPDGTVGPVGGIPVKLKGAAEDGIKKFGFPVGLRMSNDPTVGRQVDLVSSGESYGIESVEIRSLEDAYQLLTGKQLHPTGAEKPIDVSEFSLSANTAERILSVSGDVGDRSKRMIDTTLENVRARFPVSSNHRRNAESLYGEFRKYLSQAGQAEAQGSLVSAYADRIKGYAIAVALDQLTRLEVSKSRADSGKYLDFLAGELLRTLRQIENFERAIRAGIQHQDLNRQINLINTYMLIKEAEAHWNAAADSFIKANNLYRNRVNNRAQPKFTESERSVFQLFAELCGQNLIVAAVRTDLAKDWNSLSGSDFGKVEVDSMTYLESVSSSYAQGARAALSYFGATYVDQLGETGSLRFYLMESLYLPAKKAVFGSISSDLAASEAFGKEISKILVDKKKQQEDTLDSFCGGTYAYLTVSRLILKYYNFNYSLTGEGNENRLRGFRAAIELLDIVRKQSPPESWQTQRTHRDRPRVDPDELGPGQRAARRQRFGQAQRLLLILEGLLPRRRGHRHAESPTRIREHRET